LAVDANHRTLMDANSLLMSRFKMQSNKFTGTISKSFGKVKKRLIKEMIYGIQLQFVTRLKMSRYLHFGKNITGRLGSVMNVIVISNSHITWKTSGF
jgi:hypothetical protein